MTRAFFYIREEERRVAKANLLSSSHCHNQLRVIPNGAQRNEGSPSVTVILRGFPLYTYIL
jgi:hypothetical protein